MKRTGIPLLFLAILLISACTPQAGTMTQPTADTMMKPTAEAMMQPTADTMMQPTADTMMKPTAEVMMQPTADAMMKPTAGAMMAARWVGAALKDVNSGKTFKVSDFKGKVVVVELMAVWCTTCLQQEKTIQPLLNGAGMDFEYISLDIDANENELDLGKYAQQNQFPWKLAVASRETAHEIGQIYGDSYLNPPSAPILVVDKEGEVHPLALGLKDADAFKKALEPFSGM
jgi:thiol-disulfide isomerase/thioredoxin